MKKLLFVLLLVHMVSFGQTKEDQQTSVFIKKSIKELISIQSLLAENRIDEFNSFINDNNFIPSGKNLYTKLLDKTNDKRKLGYGFHVFENPRENNASIGIGVYFVDLDTGKILSFTSKEKANLFVELFADALEVGSRNLYGFNNMKNQIVEKYPDKIKVIDRYKFLLLTKNEWIPYSVSNTTRMWESFYAFFGPGKTAYTGLDFKIEKPNSSSFYELRIIITSNIEKIKLKDENFVNPFERQSFDLDFFMGLDSFNDIIWNDN